MPFLYRQTPEYRAIWLSKLFLLGRSVSARREFLHQIFLFEFLRELSRAEPRTQSRSVAAPNVEILLVQSLKSLNFETVFGRIYYPYSVLFNLTDFRSFQESYPFAKGPSLLFGWFITEMCYIGNALEQTFSFRWFRRMRLGSNLIMKPQPLQDSGLESVRRQNSDLKFFHVFYCLVFLISFSRVFRINLLHSLFIKKTPAKFSKSTHEFVKSLNFKLRGRNRRYLLKKDRDSISPVPEQTWSWKNFSFLFFWNAGTLYLFELLSKKLPWVALPAFTRKEQQKLTHFTVRSLRLSRDSALRSALIAAARKTPTSPYRLIGRQFKFDFFEFCYNNAIRPFYLCFIICSWAWKLFGPFENSYSQRLKFNFWLALLNFPLFFNLAIKPFIKHFSFNLVTKIICFFLVFCAKYVPVEFFFFVRSLYIFSSFFVSDMHSFNWVFGINARDLSWFCRIACAVILFVSAIFYVFSWLKSLFMLVCICGLSIIFRHALTAFSLPTFDPNWFFFTKAFTDGRQALLILKGTAIFTNCYHKVVQTITQFFYSTAFYMLFLACRAFGWLKIRKFYCFVLPKLTQSKHVLIKTRRGLSLFWVSAAVSFWNVETLALRIRPVFLRIFDYKRYLDIRPTFWLFLDTIFSVRGQLGWWLNRTMFSFKKNFKLNRTDKLNFLLENKGLLLHGLNIQGILLFFLNILQKRLYVSTQESLILAESLKSKNQFKEFSVLVAVDYAVRASFMADRILLSSCFSALHTNVVFSKKYVLSFTRFIRFLILPGLLLCFLALLCLFCVIRFFSRSIISIFFLL